MSVLSTAVVGGLLVGCPLANAGLTSAHFAGLLAINAKVATVSNCDDNVVSDPPIVGSLREAVANAKDGDVIDLGSLACSTITLKAGEILVDQPTLTIRGRSAQSLRISGSKVSRVIAHAPAGAGQLTISNLTLADGYIFSESTRVVGGCIASTSDLLLDHAEVKQCIARSNAGAAGGGVYAGGTAVLLSSNVSGNSVISVKDSVVGGGVSASKLTAKYSSITGNTAYGSYSQGGGAWCATHALISRSTIAGNFSNGDGGGIYFLNNSTLTSSTISGNVANFHGGGIGAAQQAIAYVSNSTIVSNYAYYNGGGIHANTLVLNSSIVAGNIGGYSQKTKSDIVGSEVTGANNVVVASSASLPPGTITDAPMIGPLQFNGGPTKTHALLPGSPAIGHGDNPSSLLWDQRGVGYPRTTSSLADIGAYQYDSIFADRFGDP